MHPGALLEVVPGAGEMLGHVKDQCLAVCDSAPLFPSPSPVLAGLAVLHRGTPLSLAGDQDFAHSLGVLWHDFAFVDMDFQVLREVGAVVLTARNLTLAILVVRRFLFCHVRFLAALTFPALGSWPGL